MTARVLLSKLRKEAGGRARRGVSRRMQERMSTIWIDASAPRARLVHVTTLFTMTCASDGLPKKSEFQSSYSDNGVQRSLSELWLEKCKEGCESLHDSETLN